MAVFRCKMCGGILEFRPGDTVGVCDSCGTKQTLPRLTDEKRAGLYEKADRFRRNNDYDRASEIYKKILEEDSEDAEVYWSLVLCRYGIEYVEDPLTHRRIPTMNRTQYTSIFQDEDYQLALKYADAEQQNVYKDEAAAINSIQKEYLAISGREKAYDVFICYKESDESGKTTADSGLAFDLYTLLTKEGYRVFYAPVSLEDKIGKVYEPYIFAALNSAPVMLAVGTRKEYFESVWVRNEWKRFLMQIRENGNKILIPAYKDMDPHDLPVEFSHLQALNMAQPGFKRDLLIAVRKYTRTDLKKGNEENLQGTSSNNTAQLVRRMFLFLEEGDWNNADRYTERILDQDPECGYAYLGKLMIEVRVEREEDLAEIPPSYKESVNYQRILRFGDEKLKSTVKGYLSAAEKKEEEKRIEARRKAEEARIAARKRLEADRLAAEKKREEDRKDGIYYRANVAMKNAKTSSQFAEAAELFSQIPGVEDADELRRTCEIKQKALLAREKTLKKVIMAVVSAGILILIWQTAVLPRLALNHTYKEGVSLYKKGEFSEAIEIFERLGDFRDSEQKIEQCKTGILDAEYDAAMSLYKEGKYKKAMAAFNDLGTYRDSQQQAENCWTALMNKKYDAAMTLFQEGNYEEAQSAFENLEDFRDSEKQVENCILAIREETYAEGVAFYESGDYESALAVFESLGDYNDCAEQIDKCHTAIKDEAYDNAAALEKEGQYSEAIEAFQNLDGYKDSKERIEACETAILQGKYDHALSLFEKKEYESAYTEFVSLESFKDSKEKAQEILVIKSAELLKGNVSPAVGAEYEFGTYNKGKITWTVLAAEKNRALLLAKDALAFMPYHTQSEVVNWNKCSLRTWLNEDFYSSSFDAAERALIEKTENKSASANGKTAEDHVFLLSDEEVRKYMPEKGDRICRESKTAGIRKSYADKNGNVSWWLRSTGSSGDTAIVVNNDGTLIGVEDGSSGKQVNYQACAVRPAIWVTIQHEKEGD